MSMYNINNLIVLIVIYCSLSTVVLTETPPSLLLAFRTSINDQSLSTALNVTSLGDGSVIRAKDFDGSTMAVFPDVNNDTVLIFGAIEVYWNIYQLDYQTLELTSLAIFKNPSPYAYQATAFGYEPSLQLVFNVGYVGAKKQFSFVSWDFKNSLLNTQPLSLGINTVGQPVGCYSQESGTYYIMVGVQGGNPRLVTYDVAGKTLSPTQYELTSEFTSEPFFSIFWIADQQQLYGVEISTNTTNGSQLTSFNLYKINLNNNHAAKSSSTANLSSASLELAYSIDSIFISSEFTPYVVDTNIIVFFTVNNEGNLVTTALDLNSMQSEQSVSNQFYNKDLTVIYYITSHYIHNLFQNLNKFYNFMSSMMKSKGKKAALFDDDIQLECFYNDNNWDARIFDKQARPIGSTARSEFTTTESKEIQVKIGLSEWNKLVKDNEKLALQSYSIERASYVGTAETHSVRVQCNFDILVFSTNQQIPLLPSSIALTSSSIKYSSHINDAEPNTVDKNSCIGVIDNAHQFFPEKAGKYHLKLEVLVNYLTAKKNGFGFSSPKSTFNQISISVPREVQIKIDPVSSQTEHVKNDGESISTSTASIPPTPYIKVQWTDFEIEEIVQVTAATPVEKKQSEQAKATVQQYTLCSVGEGVVVLNSSIKYSMVSGSLSSMEVIISNNLNVLSVEGMGIKKWECFPIAPLVEISNAARPPATEKLVKILLNSPIEDNYIFNLISEFEMSSTSSDIAISSIRCRGSEISREKGFLVVEKSTANVEVEHLAREGLTLIDKTEVPHPLAQMASGPLLLSYKFLDPKYKLDIRITKHSDLQVLVAICESAHFMATLSSEGALLKKLIFNIRNTQQQYIRIPIQHRFEIWSTIVAGKAVKPAQDENGSVMIPLSKSSGTERGIQKPFQVVLVYKHAADTELFNEGKLDLTFPSIDIPISQLYVSLYLPKDYKYSQIDGNIKEVSHFFGKVPDDSVCESSKAAPQQMMLQQIMPQQQMMSNMMSNPILSNSNIGFGGGATPLPSDDNDTAGLKPVIVNIPKSGMWIKLEQLLVISQEIQISVKYSQKKKCC
ncbi:hypothetical protein PPL_05867 [Heterostelium album PN500]|uniref:Uncharacterized protein n=1 Tax=Heterostelium pallidum (strain ATCC 26659 / Pp 5 / PN500) TaxID=670386 RepID=D3BBJ9_HETP5|nr:hypothetical protein PPL_05867 [Heterostelium album PN500]EFA81032.1 hypothetical protein PPL_05867 [Heterostelium album PN500]|eukprot:XP_020433150.1 hypothetical protein PPL_05867 [Heterostelium album PN500]